MHKFPEEYFSANNIKWKGSVYWSFVQEMEDAIRQVTRRTKHRSVTLAFTYIGGTSEMAGKKSDSRNVQSGDRRSSKPSYAPVKWTNVPLVQSDQTYLAAQSPEPGVLAAMVLEWVSNGGAFTLKFLDNDGSYMACLVYKSPDGSGRLGGVSAFSNNPANALLCLCYKIDIKLAGQLPDVGVTDDTPSDTFR